MVIQLPTVTVISFSVRMITATISTRLYNSILCQNDCYHQYMVIQQHSLSEWLLPSVHGYTTAFSVRMTATISTWLYNSILCQNDNCYHQYTVIQQHSLSEWLLPSVHGYTTAFSVRMITATISTRLYNSILCQNDNCYHQYTVIQQHSLSEL